MQGENIETGESRLDRKQAVGMHQVELSHNTGAFSADRGAAAKPATMASVSLDVVDSVSGLEEIESQWEDLFGACGHNTPSMSWEWNYHWWRHYGEGHQMQVYLVRGDGGAPLGIVPLMLRRSHWPRSRELCCFSDFRGSGYLEPLLRTGCERACLHELCERLSRQDGWDKLRFSRFRAGTPAVWALCRAAVESGLRGEVTARAWGAYARLPHTFEEYLDGLSPRRRKKARWILNRLAKQHRMCFRTAETEGEVVEGILWWIRQKRERMHRLGRWTWLDDPRYLPFLQEYAVAAFQKDHLRLYLLQLDDNLAACMLVLLAGNTAVFDTDAYDEKHEAESVADAVQLLSTRACIEAGPRIMDLGQALQPHKTHYAKEREAVIEMEFYRNQPRSLVCEAASHLGAPVWHVSRNLLPGKLKTAIVRRVKRDAAPRTRPEEPCG